MTDKNPTAVKSSQPTATAGEVGIGANVLRELDSKVHPSIAAKIREHLEKKTG